ncbi:two-component sensor histidine kinase [Geomicrobium sp. JCM 19037]|uniref:ATP-binding protein n=1 Tax=Geomicrobium sp. JCM 19037 TaxID=1460634 RepID=UPI00045F4B58|nr:ATP-binding protein [Geomicrobium sp. JCM 19037]GAK02264.1 two-component sensor histidine kinase [Geomicrobium sp. JCM 19037]
MNPTKWRFQYRMMLITSLLLLVTLLLAGLLIAQSQANQTRESLEQQAMLSATHLAVNPLVISALVSDEPNAELSEIAARLREDNDLLYIVIMDMDGIRLTHPTAEQVGERFVGDDVHAVLANGDRYTSEEVGTLGPSMRAFHPVMNEENQIGAISVGISTQRIEDSIFQSQQIVFIATGVSMLIGAAGACLLALRLKRTLHNLEPEAIAQRLKEREAMLESVQEGVIATDNEGTIIVMNEAAIHALEKDHVGKPLNDVWPKFPISEPLWHDRKVLDDLQVFQDTQMITNRIPVKVGNDTVGALVTFRNRNELDQALERLSGVEHYAQALRFQTHEFMNKLHVIGAMVHTKSFEELQEYVDYLSDQYNAGINEIATYVKDITLAGYVANQIDRLEKADVNVTLSGNGGWLILTEPRHIDRWITIIGNALNNAYEAMIGQEQKRMTLSFASRNDQLVFEVQDNGKGFDTSQLPDLLKSGVSTNGAHRGFGLTIMTRAVEQAGGTYAFTSSKGEGTTLTITMPAEVKEDHR